ncbi:hypothetical protein V6N12_029003 [Hibiscus sabdariffa]|uniref:Isopenicillin N synthase-like Fe(2+) 2OG dioxygenase domain-containing protein n=1 Tax=Hibiscus sabdariffa TaxID=183260 RepID=A0ABR2F7L0_9ROSI
MGPEPLHPQELPPVCRDITMEYSEQIHKLGTRALVVNIGDLLQLMSNDKLKSVEHQSGLDTRVQGRANQAESLDLGAGRPNKWERASCLESCRRRPIELGFDLEWVGGGRS